MSGRNVKAEQIGGIADRILKARAMMPTIHRRAAL
jgi:hypothetical protein